MTLHEFQKEIVARSEESLHPIDDWSPMEYAARLACEAGEALRELIRMRRLEDGDRPYNRGIKAEDLIKFTGKELGDIVAFCALLAERLELDLEDEVRNKFNEVSERVGSQRRL